MNTNKDIQELSIKQFVADWMNKNGPYYHQPMQRWMEKIVEDFATRQPSPESKGFRIPAIATIMAAAAVLSAAAITAPPVVATAAAHRRAAVTGNPLHKTQGQHCAGLFLFRRPGVA